MVPITVIARGGVVAHPAPYSDLLTWTFGNAAVPDEQPILIDAEAEPLDQEQPGFQNGNRYGHAQATQLSPSLRWQQARQLTKQDLRILVRQLIAGFRRLEEGSEQKVVVCVHSFNHLVYPAIFLAAIGAGGRWTGSNPAYTVGELVHHLRISKANVVITGLECLQVAAAAAKECGIASDRLFILNAPSQTVPPNLRRWHELCQYGEADWITFNDEITAKNTTAGLFSTSGTTGLPKMAERSHFSFVSENFALREKHQKPYQIKRLISIPLFHAFASAVGLVSCLADGRTTYIMRRFNRQSFLNALDRYKITETAMVPPLLVEFLKYPPADQIKLRSLELVWCAGSPLDPGVQAQAVRLFAPTARIVQVWGMTECGWISTFAYPENDTTGSVGRLIPGFQAKLINNNGDIMAREDESGEVCVRSPMLMRGYLGDAKATKDTIDEQGWLHTGDIGFIKQEKIYIVDRKKELIKVRGWQIAPAELEGTLLMHPAIADAAVIGVPKGRRSSFTLPIRPTIASITPSSSPTTALFPVNTISSPPIPIPTVAEEIPRAYIVPSPTLLGRNLTPEGVRAHLLHHLARYKVAECEIRFVDSIPKSASGKILRKILRAEAAAENDGEKSTAAVSTSGLGLVLPQRQSPPTPPPSPPPSSALPRSDLSSDDTPEEHDVPVSSRKESTIKEKNSFISDRSQTPTSSVTTTSSSLPAMEKDKEKCREPTVAAQALALLQALWRWIGGARLSFVIAEGLRRL